MARLTPEDFAMMDALGGEIIQNQNPNLLLPSSSSSLSSSSSSLEDSLSDEITEALLRFLSFSLSHTKIDKRSDHNIFGNVLMKCEDLRNRSPEREEEEEENGTPLERYIHIITRGSTTEKAKLCLFLLEQTTEMSAKYSHSFETIVVGLGNALDLLLYSEDLDSQIRKELRVFLVGVGVVSQFVLDSPESVNIDPVDILEGYARRIKFSSSCIPSIAQGLAHERFWTCQEIGNEIVFGYHRVLNQVVTKLTQITPPNPSEFTPSKQINDFVFFIGNVVSSLRILYGYFQGDGDSRIEYDILSVFERYYKVTLHSPSSNWCSPRQAGDPRVMLCTILSPETFFRKRFRCPHKPRQQSLSLGEEE